MLWVLYGTVRYGVDCINIMKQNFQPPRVKLRKVWLNIKIKIKREQIRVCHIGLDTNFEIQEGICYWIKNGLKTRKTSYEPSANKDPQESPKRFWQKLTKNLLFSQFSLLLFTWRAVTYLEYKIPCEYYFQYKIGQICG